MSSITAGHTTNKLRLTFSQHGFPEEFISNEFAEFMNRNGIEHTQVPPYHSQLKG